MSDERAREIAGSIAGTPQAAAVLGARCDDEGGWWIRLGSGRGLTPLGLTARSIDGHALTPLGFAVRRILEEANNGK